jgi:hypothetical protein
MSERHIIGILTAILCSQHSLEHREVDLDNVVVREMALGRRGMAWRPVKWDYGRPFDLYCEF